MAIKIPVAQRQVAEQPQVPDAPTISAAPSSAFGIQEAQAGAQMGEAVSKLGTALGAHLESQMKIQAETNAYDAANRLRERVTPILYSTDLQTVKGPDGKEYQIQSGVLNRKGTQAEGALVDFNTRYSSEYEKIYKDLKNPYSQRMFQRQAATLGEGYKQAVTKHAATEWNLDKLSKYENAKNLAIGDAGQVVDPVGLHTAIYREGGIVSAVEGAGKFRGDSPEKITASTKKAITEAADNASMNTLLTGGGLPQAMIVLDSVKGSIPPDKYNDLSEKLRKKSEQLEADASDVTRFAKTAVEIDIIGKASEGQLLSKADLDKYAFDADGKPIVSTTFYEKQLNAILKPVKPTPMQQSAAYERVLSGFYDLKPYKRNPDAPGLGYVQAGIGSAQDIINFREKVLTENAPYMTADDRKDFMRRTEAAYKLAKENPEKFKKNQSMMQNALGFIVGYGKLTTPGLTYGVTRSFLKYMDDKQPTPQNLDAGLKQAFKDNAIVNKPGVSLRENPVNAVINGSGNIDFLSPMTSDEQPDVVEKPVRVKVRNKATGEKGSILETDFNSDTYDLL